MSAISDYLENKLIDHVLRGVTYTRPSKVYAALYKTNPTDADTGTEVSGGSYARQEVTFSAPVDGETSNASDILFPEATSDWGDITHLLIDHGRKVCIARRPQCSKCVLAPLCPSAIVID